MNIRTGFRVSSLSLVLALAHGADAQQSAASNSAAIPFGFVENAGQWPTDIQFAARRGGITAHFGHTRFDLRLDRRQGQGYQSLSLALEFLGADRRASLHGERTQHLRHQFLGTTSSGHVARSYERLRYNNVYPGVDICVREAQGTLEYDVVLAPGADADQVHIRCTGASAMELTADGTLRLRTALGTVDQKAPTTWVEEANGHRRPVNCRYVLRGDSCYGFAVEGMDPQRPTVIDPGIVWSTYFGSNQDDQIYGMAENTSGHIFVAGSTSTLSTGVP